MTDHTELLERLRAPVPTVYDCKDAADALAAQAARIADLRKEADMMHSEYKTARARIAELEAALKPFADIDVSNCADGRVCYFWGFGENAGKVSAAEVRAARAAYLGEKE